MVKTRHMYMCTCTCRRGIVVTRLIRSAKLLYPGSG